MSCGCNSLNGVTVNTTVCNPNICPQIIDSCCVIVDHALCCGVITSVSDTCLINTPANTPLCIVLDHICIAFLQVATAINNNTSNITELQSNEVFTTKICLTSNQILLLGTNPVTLIAAPGVGKFIQILSITGKLTFNTTVYTGGASTSLLLEVLQGGQLQYDIGALLGSTITTLDTFGQSSGPMLENTAVTISTRTNANPANGDSPVCIYVTYKIITL